MTGIVAESMKLILEMLLIKLNYSYKSLISFKSNSLFPKNFKPITAKSTSLESIASPLAIDPYILIPTNELLLNNYY